MGTHKIIKEWTATEAASKKYGITKTENGKTIALFQDKPFVVGMYIQTDKADLLAYLQENGHITDYTIKKSNNKIKNK